MTHTGDALRVQRYHVGSGHFAFHTWSPLFAGEQEKRARVERSKGGLKDHEKDSETPISIRVFPLFFDV
jgi:hypothetical protein